MTDGCLKNPFLSQSAVVFYAAQTAAQHGQRSDDDEAVNHQRKEEGEAGGDGEGGQAAQGFKTQHKSRRSQKSDQ